MGLAKHLSADGIVVNAIAPGPTATSMLMGNDEQSISRPASPSGRYTTPEEVANLSVVLVSDLGRMINGDTVYVSRPSQRDTFFGDMANLNFNELASKYAVPTSEAKKIELKRKIKHIIAPIIRNRGGYNIYNYGVLFIFDFE